MYPDLLAVSYEQPLWIAIAFGFGLIFKQAKLPPMVGFLMAGFVLNFLGAQSGDFLMEIADLGVTLLLFTIGLKLQINTLIRSEIWATTIIHMGGSIVITTGMLMGLSGLGVLVFSNLDLTTAIIVAFALSFSSTVFAVKTLEDRGSLVSRYGRVAIGVLVMQDIAAVVFLAVSSGKIPSVWALCLLALIPGRHLLGLLLSHTGHKELVSVFGFVMALGGAAVFELVGMKGDLGALIMGVLLANHPKAGELAKNLMGFKDVFLVCFFLTIGLTGLPSWDTLASAAILIALVPLKILFFFWLLTSFKMRARGASLGAAVLGNYSEFGLIVGAIAISAGWLGQEWLTVIALALSISFVVASPVNMAADAFYRKYRYKLRSYERKSRLPGDEDIPLIGHRVLIFGMGRTGRAAYDEMTQLVDGNILGIDLDEKQVERNVAAGRTVVMGDATNPEFWSRLDEGHEDMEMILLAMPVHAANVKAAQRLRERDYKGPIVAVALYPEQEQDLKEHGIDEVFNIYAEAGAGAAAHMKALMDQSKPETA